MSDAPQGEGWWQASDGRWYPPDATPGYSTDQPESPGPFTPPTPAGQDPQAADFGAAPSYGTPGPRPGQPPPGYGAPGPGPGQPPNYGAVPPGASPYGAPPQKNNSKTIWIVLGVIVGAIVLLCGGCFALIAIGGNAAENSIGETFSEFALDFSDGDIAIGPSSCEVTGRQFGDDGNYEVVASITSASDVTSHYRVEYDLLGPGGDPLGSDFGVISSVDPGDTISDETTFGIVGGTPDWTDVTCSVTQTLRIDA